MFCPMRLVSKAVAAALAKDLAAREAETGNPGAPMAVGDGPMTTGLASAGVERTGFP